MTWRVARQQQMQHPGTRHLRTATTAAPTAIRQNSWTAHRRRLPLMAPQQASKVGHMRTAMTVSRRTGKPRSMRACRTRGRRQAQPPPLRAVLAAAVAVPLCRHDVSVLSLRLRLVLRTSMYRQPVPRLLLRMSVLKAVASTVLPRSPPGKVWSDCKASPLALMALEAYRCQLLTPSRHTSTALQDHDDTFLAVPVTDDVTAGEVSVDFRARSLRVAVSGEVIVAGDLPQPVHPEDCTWQFGAQPPTLSSAGRVIQRRCIGAAGVPLRDGRPTAAPGRMLAGCCQLCAPRLSLSGAVVSPQHLIERRTGRNKDFRAERYSCHTHARRGGRRGAAAVPDAGQGAAGAVVERHQGPPGARPGGAESRRRAVRRRPQRRLAPRPCDACGRGVMHNAAARQRQAATELHRLLTQRCSMCRCASSGR